MTITLDPPRQSRPTEAVTNQGASFLVATGQVASRTLKKFIRSPALLIAGTAQGLLFLLIFRYVFGGAVSHTGGLSYVDFLVPGLRRDRRALPGHERRQRRGRRQGGRALRPAAQPAHPAPLHRVGAGGRRHGARRLGRGRHDGGGLRGRLPGQRHDGGCAGGLGLTILYGFAFVWLFIALGLMAGSPQAAQGLSFLVFPLSFVSSAYVPVSTMPGWMQAFANNQPMTQMVNTVRLLTGGPQAQAAARAPGVVLPRALALVDGRVGDRLRPARRLEAEDDVTTGRR